MNRFARKHSFSHRKKCSEGSSCLSGHPCTRKCPGGRLTQLLRVTAASDFNWMNNDVWESFLPTQTLGGTILVHLVYYHAALLSLPMDPASGDGRNVLWPGCWSSPAEEREFIAQETNSASREVGSCGGIPLVNGLSSLGEVGIPDPASSMEGTFSGVLRSRCFWLVLSNPARLTQWCWKASYLICGENEPTRSILPCFFPSRNSGSLPRFWVEMFARYPVSLLSIQPHLLSLTIYFPPSSLQSCVLVVSWISSWVFMCT